MIDGKIRLPVPIKVPENRVITRSSVGDIERGSIGRFLDIPEPGGLMIDGDIRLSISVIVPGNRNITGSTITDIVICGTRRGLDKPEP